MRYDSIPVSLFEKNRKRFTDKMQKNSLAILTSNDVMPNNADDVMGFAQNNDLFYLSGIEQDETILVLFPDAFKEENRAVLFVKESNENTVLWDGNFLTKAEATTISGIKNVKWIAEFEKTLQLFAFEADTFYLGHNEHIKRITAGMQTRQDRMIQWCKEKYPLHHYERAAKITRDLRPIKSDEEIDLIKKAIAISVKGFHGILNAIQPNIKEYELEAELAYASVKNGGTRSAFKPIVASGKNACSLHYNTNDQVCGEGEMVLVDFGVCYANYNSDTTRCVPVNGVFSPRQKAVYEAVLHCLKEGSKLLKPGILSKDYELEMAKLIEAELLKLGLITQDEIANQNPDNPAYKKYFMHGTAHHLGLDVHDVGLYSRPFEKGMVLTCEPGIYIPEEGIGCRLENDYLLTENGNINLSEALPIEIADIEGLIKNNKQ
ncbi:aminopeptidase P N-terminal domain-containing protein [Flavobacterium sp. Fl-318]|uniref:Xaa-Pro aminopeptidase n=1 Tax=Flavobacterium cupriresistens TaxID=2893885 RepID=A0ABU4RDD0_9FLAO|nr:MULTISPECIES: aminopeptidase P family protein [unclassified Flavobacterium]MDX6189460.1 aminopeptidase P N-terminal domain-containing protein [Flavobacterium sp. Fl-318]UFH41131.1 aminopeptidase P N-terminal domain-containing protein [Flavobacterium sp. F-323]